MGVILGIESTCDETAAAVVAGGFNVRSNVVASQEQLHARYRGVVPEIASRAHIENILPVIRDALASSGIARGDRDAREPFPENENSAGALQVGKQEAGEREPRELARDFQAVDAIAVAHRPGLIGSLLIGVTAAKTLAWALGKPLIGVDHVQAHLYSVVLETGTQPAFPAVGLVCSGGHTALYDVQSWLDVKRIGTTLDDAVGEAYDKVAAMLGLGYPGGPILDGLAARGNPAAIGFPRTLLDRDSLDFSFSGLKTAVLYHVRGVPRRGENVKAQSARTTPDPSELADIAASFQSACIDVLLEKLRRALALTGGRSVIVGGGVSANRALRGALGSLGVPVYVPPLRYCTDNAAMSAGLAQVYLSAGRQSGLDLDAITFSDLAAIKR